MELMIENLNKYRSDFAGNRVPYFIKKNKMMKIRNLESDLKNPRISADPTQESKRSKNKEPIGGLNGLMTRLKEEHHLKEIKSLEKNKEFENMVNEKNKTQIIKYKSKKLIDEPSRSRGKYDKEGNYVGKILMASTSGFTIMKSKKEL